jgi:hypothetical protein
MIASPVAVRHSPPPPPFTLLPILTPYSYSKWLHYVWMDSFRFLFFSFGSVCGYLDFSSVCTCMRVCVSRKLGKLGQVTQTIFIPYTTKAVSGTNTGQIILWDYPISEMALVSGRDAVKVLKYVCVALCLCVCVCCFLPPSLHCTRCECIDRGETRGRIEGSAWAFDW